MSLGENVRRLRNGLGLSQAELAEVIGTSQPKISEIENGQILSPHLDRLVALAGVFGTSLDDLVGCRKSNPSKKS